MKYIFRKLCRMDFIKIYLQTEAVTDRCSIKQVFLEISQNSQENVCARITSLIKFFIKKETLPQVFSCEFCEISKSNCSYRTPLVAASASTSILPVDKPTDNNSVITNYRPETVLDTSEICKTEMKEKLPLLLI